MLNFNFYLTKKVDFQIHYLNQNRSRESIIKNNKKELNAHKNNFMLSMRNVPYCSDEEEKEIIELLNNLTDDDLTIVKKSCSIMII